MDASQSAARGHVRNKSSKANRPTASPLDARENPLASPTAAPAPAPPLRSPSTHSLTTPARYVSARRNSPGPASPLARSSVPPPASPAMPSPSPRAKDFSYLLRPDIYQPLLTTTTSSMTTTFTAVPPPFSHPDLQPPADMPLDDLVARGYFRAAAAAAAQKLTTIGKMDPTDHARIFDLLYTRLTCLLLIDATPAAAHEAKALEDLNSAFYRDDVTGAHLVPWPLRVLHVRLMALSFGDPRRAVMSYYELAVEARAQASAALANDSADAEEAALWQGRLAELGIKVAGALIEMDDLTGAAAHLASMRRGVQGQGQGTHRLGMAQALLWLQLGDVDEARAVLGQYTAADDDDDDDDLVPRVVAALCDMADGNYQQALLAWQDLHEAAPDDEMVTVNLAVCLVYVGRMVEGRALLEGLVAAAECSSHTLLFNLSTMYELCSDRSKALKQGLAQRVASMGPSAGGWERTNAAFKL